MGVNKLWDILLTTATKKEIEDLSGLTLAIDASVWIYKVNAVFQEPTQALNSIFNKILWLKKNNIRPIFVFDGQSPALKKKTLEERRTRRKEISEAEIAKKVEIEIVKQVTGERNSQKAAAKANFEEKSSEIEKMLENLTKYSSTDSNIFEISEKVSLQHEVLNKKYELFCECIPKITKKYGKIEEFWMFELEEKENILDSISSQEGGSIFPKRFLSEKMSEEEKIYYEMELISKKAQIRELQDKLYRKLSSKKIENGFEIIESIYKGKKIIQKRKIKEESFEQWEARGRGRGGKGMCNDFREIFKKGQEGGRATEGGEGGEGDSGDEDGGDFFAGVFNKDYSQGKRDSSGTFERVTQKLNEAYIPKNKSKPSNKNFHPKKYQQLETEQFFSLEEVEPKNSQQNSQEKSNQDDRNSDPDNFPDFLHIEELSEMLNHHIPSSSLNSLPALLSLLEVPYIQAPAEAEAQCAQLEIMGLVDGVVTEDSDVFLFGARKVYRGVYQDNIKYFSMKNIEEKLLLTREKMIMFGLMLGSDYTDGIKGIGIVNAMEILKVHNTIESLQKFTQWAVSADVILESEDLRTDKMIEKARSQEEKEFYLLHRKYKNYWYVHPKFPEIHIYEAYTKPEVNKNLKHLESVVNSENKPDIELVTKLMSEKFAMNEKQIEHNLKILAKEFKKERQPEIGDYGYGPIAKIVSKRLQKAIGNQRGSQGQDIIQEISVNSQNSENPENPESRENKEDEQKCEDLEQYSYQNK